MSIDELRDMIREIAGWVTYSLLLSSSKSSLSPEHKIGHNTFDGLFSDDKKTARIFGGLTVPSKHVIPDGRKPWLTPGREANCNDLPRTT